MEYKFRGKLKDNNWVYGSLVSLINRCFIITEQARLSFERGEASWIMFSDEWYEVIPETVGKFTGLIDKNGKEIYVGDKIKNWQGGWNIVIYKAPSFEATVSEDQSSMYTEDWWKQTEVIGNIHCKIN